MDNIDISDAKIRDLLCSIKKLNRELHSLTMRKWNRSLPMEELLFDRWERAKQLGFGKGSSIYQSSHVYGDVKVGSNTWIGPFVVLDGTGGLKIGNNCSISAGVKIYTHDSVKWAVSGGKAKYDYSNVGIGNCSYIGVKTVIVKGVNIGSHCVIGACSFVNSDIPSYTIAVGIPARPIGKVKIGKNKKIYFIYEK